MKEIIEYKQYRRISIGMTMVFIILLMFSKLLIQWVSPELVNNRIMPLFWGIFLFLFFLFIPKVHPIGRISKRENIYLESIVCAAILTGIQFLAGSMIGQMGESPYILTPKGILNNLLFILPPIIVREIVRSYILGTYCRKTNIKVFILVTAVLTLLDINYQSLLLTKTLKDFTIYLAEEFGPLLCQNILLSYLALYGGAFAAISYIGLITIFHWTSPILPVLNWLAEGTIGILVPIFSLLFIIKKYEIQANNTRRERADEKGEAIQWTLTALFSIGLIWFVIGVFPIMPSVVATGSMEPMIKPGDIVLLKQIRSEDQIYHLKSGDIIQFKRDNILITHRIVDLEKDKKGKLLFRTKGDNNSVEDSQLVDPNDIKGIYVKAIPKLGYPTLLLKGHFSNAPKGVEF
ncbi:MAG: signal peptidase I [Bacillota bacterium]